MSTVYLPIMFALSSVSFITSSFFWVQVFYLLKVKVKVKSLSRVRLFATPWTVAYQAPPPVGFSRQEYWSGLPFPSPGDLPNPGIKPGSPALQADALPSEPPDGKKPLVKVKKPLVNVKYFFILKNSLETDAVFLHIIKVCVTLLKSQCPVICCFVASHGLPRSCYW